MGDLLIILAYLIYNSNAYMTIINVNVFIFERISILHRNLYHLSRKQITKTNVVCLKSHGETVAVTMMWVLNVYLNLVLLRKRTKAYFCSTLVHTGQYTFYT